MERRDPIDRMVDFAFGVPMAGVAVSRELTKLAAHRLLRSAQRAGADLAVRFVDERAAGSFAAGFSSDSTPTDTDPVGEVLVVEEAVETADLVDDGASVDGVSVEIDVIELAIEGYEHLSARQIVGLLSDLTDEELADVEAFERAGRARRTVLGKIEQVLDDRAGQ